jgi:hypothetical protein
MRGMPRDEDDDLYDEEFDFVDDDDETDDDVDEEGDGPADETSNGEVDEEPREAEGDDEPVDEYGRPETTPANYVVHIYEHRKFTRTIERPFTPEDAEAFATEFNRTSKAYGRVAVSGKNDAKPKKTLD